jgi:DNA-binding MarR family transcriptional regulator
VIGTGLMVQKPNVTRLLDRLTEVGLVERFRPEDDRRVVKVRLTRAGTDLVEKVHGPLVEHNRELLRSIPQGDLKRLAQLLGRALDAVR